jgi:hypothetical protein
MATERDLEVRGFRSCRVTARTLNIQYPDPANLGPFCRLVVEDSAPLRPGVYVWAKDGDVMYVGNADQLRQIVHGARMQRAYNDYTYIPASKVQQASSPRVRVNGLLNRALCEGSEVTWWWIETPSAGAAVLLEGQLIAEWDPPWNRARPTVLGT